MPDFPRFALGWYGLRLRPNDRLRKFVSQYLVDFINYLDTTSIYFDLRIAMPKNINIDDIISYNWILCDKNDVPLSKIGDPQYRLYNTQGSGNIHINNLKEKNVSYLKVGNTILKKYPRIVNIGKLSRSDHYKIVMIFNNNSGVQLMAQFTVLDRDKFWGTIFWSIMGGGIFTGIIEFAIRHFG